MIKQPTYIRRRYGAAAGTTAAGTTAARGHLCFVAIFSLVSALPVHALDLNGPGGVQTRTAAFSEWLKNQSDHKIYGAETILDRDRRPFRPDGIRAGNLFFLPEIGAAAVYDDNIFASQKDAEADVRSEIAPSIKIQSQLPRHALEIGAGAKIVNYARHSELDEVDGYGQFAGALHLDHGHTLALSLLSKFEHKDRNDVFAPLSASEPVGVWQNEASLALTRDAGRLYGTISGGITDTDYNDVKALDGSLIDQDGRDYATYYGQLNWGYRYSPGYELVGKARLQRRLTRGNDTADRDATGYEALAGVAFEFNPLLRFRLLAGYGIRDYDRAEFRTTGTGLIEAGVQWLATQQMTLAASVRRNFGELSATDGQAHVDTAATASIQYEIWRNLLLTGGVSAREADGDNDARRDLVVTGTAGLEYLPSKHWAFNFSYEHQSRISDLERSDLERNNIRAGAKLRF